MEKEVKPYDPRAVELKWQERWEKDQIYATPANPQSGSKKYILDMFPYPSGAGLHVGHPEGYVATDIYSRFLRMQGHAVLHPMGWDAFGLPAENYAIKTGVHPAESTQKNIATFKRQIRRLGLSYDWKREINTSSPDYYQWTQWLFLQLYKKGLAYRRKAPVNWCPGCHTVLANEQVVNGKCERSGDTIEQKELEQWFFKITEYAAELLKNLDQLDWPDSIKSMQRNWIGESKGALINFKISSPWRDPAAAGQSSNFKIDIFTTRPDTLFGATYVVLAPEHPLVSQLEKQISNWDEVEKYIADSKKKTNLERTDLAREKTGVELKGVKAINPANNEEIPIWIADYVLSSYGTGAIMAVPAHDERDFEFAQKFKLEIKRVIGGGDLPYVGEGKMENSVEFDGMPSAAAKNKITEKVGGKLTTQYKLRDWLISRQRYWGAPIPIIYCEKCGAVSVPEDQLPVKLPTDVDFKPTGESPLALSKIFHDVKCPSCHSPAKRESDTLDTFVDSSWYYLAYVMRGISNFSRCFNRDPDKSSGQFPISKYREEFACWLPVDTYVGGAEHAVLHLLYARFISKALRDLGYLDFAEPFLSLRNQGLILAEDGRKMSKSFGNVINPDEIVDKFGADAFRIYEMFMGPLEDAKPWSTQSIVGAYRFLERVWKISQTQISSEGQEFKNELNSLIQKVTADIKAFSFNTAVAALMSFVKIVKKQPVVPSTWRKFIIALSPFAPHLAQEVWEILGQSGYIAQTDWPAAELVKLGQEFDLPVQINGKLRAVIKVDRADDERAVITKARQNEKIKKQLEGKKINLVKYIPLKILTFVVV